MGDLKPCPIHHNLKPTSAINNQELSINYGRWEVYCPIVNCIHITKDTREEAEALWNTRPRESELEAEVETLASALQDARWEEVLRDMAEAVGGVSIKEAMFMQIAKENGMLRAENRKLREIINFYADTKSWSWYPDEYRMSIVGDGGNKARELLKELEGEDD